MFSLSFNSVYPFQLGTLPIDTSIIQNVFCFKDMKYFGKYGRVFQDLLFYRYKIKPNLINSYSGPHKTTIHMRCGHCKQLYKLTAKTSELSKKLGMEYSLVSNHSNFCHCGI